MRNCRGFVLAAGATLVTTSCAVAPAWSADLGDQDDEAATGLHGFVVLGGGVEPDFEGSSDYAATPHIYANLTAYGFGLELEGPQATLNIRPDAAFQFGPSIGYDLGRDGTTNKVVDRLDKIDGAFEAGGFVAYQFNALLAQSDVFEISADLMADLSGVHDGVSGTINASYQIAATERLRLGLDASVGLASDSYMDTYFGVSQAGSNRSGLAAYTASGGIKDVGIGATASFSITENWGIVGRAEYSRLLGDAADSPIVKQEGSADQFEAGIGLFYAF